MKKLKKLKIIFLFTFVMATFISKAQTVYITDTGKKYHAKNCSVAKTGKKGIELAEAKKQGYEPCKVCKKDDASSVKTDKKEEPKDKSKAEDKTKKDSKKEENSSPTKKKK